MSITFRLDRASGLLVDGEGRAFDLESKRWNAGAPPLPPTSEAATPFEAVRWMQRETPFKIRVPVGVIGPLEATGAQLRTAEGIGAGLADMGFSVICGGRGGVTEATCNGVRRAGGLSIGLLPEGDTARANDYVGIPIATGLGEGRNVILARAAFVLVAIGDSYGILSQVALGRHYDKTVVGIAGAAKLDGVIQAESVEEVLDTVAARALAIDR